jgi:formamidopyrimidine-DNA glycosylase
MPELPEVETVRAGLQHLLVGQIVSAVSSDNYKSFPNAEEDVKQFLINAKVSAVRRRAKVLLIDLSSEYTLVIHLKMTGQMVYVRGGSGGRFGAGHPSPSLGSELPDRSTRVIISLEKAKLFFNDQRKFGWMKLMPTIEVESLDFFKKVGPEPLSADFQADQFIRRLQRRKNSNIKAVLLDQTVIAGIGNIYADESLWGAKIHPSTLIRNVSRQKLKKLFVEIQYVLNLAIEKGGSTDKNYVNAEGKKGSYLEFARVFRRQNLPCPRCGTTIEKIRVAGRGTHYCPYCQPSPSKENK